MARPSTGLSSALGALPVVTEPRCNICNSKNRRHIERLMAGGFTAVAIAEELIRADEDFKEKKLDTVRRNVSRHAEKHLNIKDRAVRAVIEKRAAEQGALITEEVERITTARSLLDLVVDRGHDQLQDPDYKVRMADVIEATKMLEDIARQEYVSQVEVMQRQVWAISQALQIKMKDQDTLSEIVNLANQLFDNPEILDDNIVQQPELEPALDDTDL